MQGRRAVPSAVSVSDSSQNIGGFLLSPSVHRVVLSREVQEGVASLVSRGNFSGAIQVVKSNKAEEFLVEIIRETLDDDVGCGVTFAEAMAADPDAPVVPHATIVNLFLQHSHGFRGLWREAEAYVLSAYHTHYKIRMGYSQNDADNELIEVTTNAKMWQCQLKYAMLREDEDLWRQLLNVDNSNRTFLLKMMPRLCARTFEYKQLSLAIRGLVAANELTVLINVLERLVVPVEQEVKVVKKGAGWRLVRGTVAAIGGGLVATSGIRESAGGDDDANAAARLADAPVEDRDSDANGCELHSDSSGSDCDSHNEDEGVGAHDHYGHKHDEDNSENGARGHGHGHSNWKTNPVPKENKKDKRRAKKAREQPFQDNEVLQSLLVMSAVMSSNPLLKHYIQTLQNFDCEAIASVCIGMGLVEEAFICFDKAKQYDKAADTLIVNAKERSDVVRARSYAQTHGKAIVDQVESWIADNAHRVPCLGSTHTKPLFRRIEKNTLAVVQQKQREAKAEEERIRNAPIREKRRVQRRVEAGLQAPEIPHVLQERVHVGARLGISASAARRDGIRARPSSAMPLARSSDAGVSFIDVMGAPAFEPFSSDNRVRPRSALARLSNLGNNRQPLLWGAQPKSPSRSPSPSRSVSPERSAMSQKHSSTHHGGPFVSKISTAGSFVTSANENRQIVSNPKSSVSPVQSSSPTNGSCVFLTTTKATKFDVMGSGDGETLSGPHADRKQSFASAFVMDFGNNSNTTNHNSSNDNNIHDNCTSARNSKVYGPIKARGSRPASPAGNYNLSGDVNVRMPSMSGDVNVRMPSSVTPGTSESITQWAESRPNTTVTGFRQSLTSSMMHQRFTRVERDPYAYGYKVKKFIPAEDRAKSAADIAWEKARVHGTSWPVRLTDSMRRSHWKS